MTRVAVPSEPAPAVEVMSATTSATTQAKK